MAKRAVLPHGLMFPEKRAALILVTLVAGIVDCIFRQQNRSGSAMRIVAI
jgi:hypothetical protein